MTRTGRVLVGTREGCVTVAADGTCALELADREVGPLVPEPGGTCLAVVDGRAVWRRSAAGTWSPVAAAGITVQSITPVDGGALVGGLDEAVVLRVSDDGAVRRLEGFDRVPGREEWFAGGPPLGVRSLTTAMDGVVLLAAVHVGGIPRSVDGGTSWVPTIPILYDVHEVRAHCIRSGLVVAAASAGLCVSTDGGSEWTVFADGLAGTTALAVALLRDEVLFSVQDGPFAARSQVWRWRIGGAGVECVRDGLPTWFDGKVDTGCIASGHGRAAILDGGGSLWLSHTGSAGWTRVATQLRHALGVAIV